MALPPQSSALMAARRSSPEPLDIDEYVVISGITCDVVGVIWTGSCGDIGVSINAEFSGF